MLNGLFIKAAASRDVAEVDRLLGLAPDAATRNTMLAADNYAAFRWAAQEGHLEVLNRLWELAPYASTRNTMLAACEHAAFGGAAQRDHPKILKLLLAYSTDQIFFGAINSINNNMYLSNITSKLIEGHDKEDSEFRKDIDNLRVLIARGITKEHTEALAVANQLATYPVKMPPVTTPYISSCLNAGMLQSTQNMAITILPGLLLYEGRLEGNLIPIILDYIGTCADLVAPDILLNSSASMTDSNKREREPAVMVEGEPVAKKTKTTKPSVRGVDEGWQEYFNQSQSAGQSFSSSSSLSNSSGSLLGR